jgi:hypothetical protein
VSLCTYHRSAKFCNTLLCSGTYCLTEKGRPLQVNPTVVKERIDMTKGKRRKGKPTRDEEFIVKDLHVRVECRGVSVATDHTEESQDTCLLRDRFCHY